MMDMSKAGRFLLPHLCWLLFGCSEEDQAKRPGPVGYESESVLQLHPSSMTSGRIDWSGEADLLQGDVIFDRLSSAVGIETTSLREMIRFEFDVLEERVRIIVQDEEPGRTKAICQTYADLYLGFRREHEVRLAREALDRLDHELAESAAEVQKGRAELAKLLEEQGLSLMESDEEQSTRENDRMTYRKALEALREDPEEKIEVPEDGVLFRKDEDN